MSYSVIEPHTLRSQSSQLIILLALTAIFLLPRWLHLNAYVTVDERHWLVRSANFTQALATRSYEDTFQQGHPGVTIMWLGASSYYRLMPGFGRIAPGQFNYTTDEFDSFVRANGIDPLTILIGGRKAVIVANVIIVLLAFRLAINLLPPLVALIGFYLLVLQPFLVAHTRLLHPDSLLANLMLLSLLALLSYLYQGKSTKHLLLSGVSAGLAWLTKTPGLFLLPFVASLMIVHVAIAPRSTTDSVLSILVKAGRPLLIWSLVAIATFFLLWPALWVAPLDTIGRMLSISQEYASQGHDSAIFFAGRVVTGDPGFWFYPATYLWRTSPVTVVGLLLLPAAVYLTQSHKADRFPWLQVGGFVVFSLLFWLFITLGAKKFDRYLLPAYAPLILAASIGWAGLFCWLIARQRMPAKLTGLLVMCVFLVGPPLLLFSVYPTYLSYYNPLMGGGAAAQESMFVGWGEGMAEAAKFVNRQTAPARPTVASWYGRGPLSYFYEGEFWPAQYYWQTDYTIVYLNQRQRQAPARQLIAHWNRQKPAQTIVLDDITYAQVYANDATAMPAFVTDWNGQIRLISYTLPTGSLTVGQQVLLELYLLNLAPVERNLNMLVRIVNADGYELLRSDRWPFGSATADWQLHELWVDRFELNIPDEAPPGLYRVEIQFYDPATMNRLPATRAFNGHPLGEVIILDYMEIESEVTHQGPNQCQLWSADTTSLVQMGNILMLNGHHVESHSGRTVEAGDSLVLGLCWKSLGQSDIHYTAFVHLVNPEGELVAQIDRPILGGFLPMSLWYPGLAITENYALELPDNLAAGTYDMYVGLYDPSTVVRLPIQVNGVVTGDAHRLMRIVVN